MSSMNMIPGCGERVLRFVGDRLRFALRDQTGNAVRPGWQAFLRTNLGRAALLRHEVISAHFQKLPLAGASWCDIPMQLQGDEWVLELPLTEVGFFKAKAYATDERRRQFWPEGSDFGVSVHPNSCRTGNIIYCAWPRLFGETRNATTHRPDALQKQIESLDEKGYTVIPPSGKLRDLTQQLPHIFNTLGCKILHLLPINPTPTTFARFGRYGSPYAIQSLRAIDPALVVFDRKTTGLDQFNELVRATHLHGGELFLDLVINHTGWGADLWENHPEWYRRLQDKEFESPGAWGNIWADLVELDQRHPALWNELADVFLTWCRRGVDGFRCDAGYKVPVPVWQHIIARVRQEYPETIFLLEGLGGSWEATENLLTEGGMQWAYSELFQNYSGRDVANYLDYGLRQSDRVGLYTHYSETHDNNRLAAKGRAWSLLRNRLCALTSANGGFGFTCGVEWLAAEKIIVHECSGLAWNSVENIVPELRQVNHLLANHPAFFDGAKLKRLSPPESPILVLHRESAEGKDAVLILANTDAENAQTVQVELTMAQAHQLRVDLLGHTLPQVSYPREGQCVFHLVPGAVFCLADAKEPRGLSGDAYRIARAQAAWAVTAISQHLPIEKIGPYDWCKLADLVLAGPQNFLAMLPLLDETVAQENLLEAIHDAMRKPSYPQVILWAEADSRRVTPVPPHHWLLIQDEVAFRVSIKFNGNQVPRNLQSISVGKKHYAALPPIAYTGRAELLLERAKEQQPALQSLFDFLPAEPNLKELVIADVKAPDSPLNAPLVLLTNGIGGMSRMCVDLGLVKSKYDCVLAANLNNDFPVDRHVLIKRLRLWVNADGFITPLNGDNLISFTPGPPACWRFVANAGDGRSVEIQLCGNMVPEKNTILFHLSRPDGPPPLGRDLPTTCDVRLTVRFDIEDRNFHWETHRNTGAEHHFQSHTRPLGDWPGFTFAPARDRQLSVFVDYGLYHHEGEWTQNLWHPVEQSRGQANGGDSYSPGWFDIPLRKGHTATLVATADPGPIAKPSCTPYPIDPIEKPDGFVSRLLIAAKSFLVRRGQGKTVIAGYPWFLDWGRDTLICARGLLAAGWRDEVFDLIKTFGRFEREGTLPNTIHGEDTSNRDTTDAALWYGIVCEEYGQVLARLDVATADLVVRQFYATVVDGSGRTVLDVLRSIAEGYIRGTSNGIHMDAVSGLVWSPSHFTWMDTNFPAGTPREGYPVEIQALWIRLLRQLARAGATRIGENYDQIATRAEASFHNLYWIEAKGWFADQLIARSGETAAQGVPDQALRSNFLLAISLGLVSGERACRAVEAARHWLVVPGALRSLAPLPVTPLLHIHGNDGRLLNNPVEPYWGHYEGDEDTRRKPAYHNGTAWTWTLPIFCEALACAHQNSPAALAAARAYLGSMAALMTSGCLGHIPEILDGDAPHQQRGCDAQAWGATEALRVWKQLGEKDE